MKLSQYRESVEDLVWDQTVLWLSVSSKSCSLLIKTPAVQIQRTQFLVLEVFRGLWD